ncbi:MAG: hypothetical protein IPK91_02635 [Saprospiraceae bacterium]|nr:hypothetical protein [Saprospiraceae bacterium]MBK8296186.1 hypothetical protein [Saprospiraceae bacterium]
MISNYVQCQYQETIDSSNPNFPNLLLDIREFNKSNGYYETDSNPITKEILLKNNITGFDYLPFKFEAQIVRPRFEPDCTDEKLKIIITGIIERIYIGEISSYQNKLLEDPRFNFSEIE